MNKKAMVETQFNWIFALAIGAIILVVMIGFIMSQREKADQRISLTIAKDLNTIITQTSVSRDQAEVIDIPNKKIVFSCDPETCNKQGCTSKFEVGKSGVSWDTPVQPIFSPDEIQGNSIISWALDWNVPYHATDFVFLTSEEVRYVFVGDSQMIKKLYEGFPSEANKERTSTINSLSNLNNYKVKLIYYQGISPLPSSLVNRPSGSIKAIKIVPSDGEDYGEISFYTNVKGQSELNREPNNYDYIGLPGIYAAIFAEDSENYLCGIKKSMMRLYLASLVYDRTADKYIASPQVSQSCKSYYNKDAISEVGISALTMDYGQESDNMYQNSVRLRADNHNLKIYSCPLLY